MFVITMGRVPSKRKEEQGTREKKDATQDLFAFVPFTDNHLPPMSTFPPPFPLRPADSRGGGGNGPDIRQEMHQRILQCSEDFELAILLLPRQCDSRSKFCNVIKGPKGEGGGGGEFPPPSSFERGDPCDRRRGEEEGVCCREKETDL